MKKLFGLTVIVASSLALAACGEDSNTTTPTAYEDLDVGTYLSTYIADGGQTATEIAFVAENDYQSDLQLTDLTVTYSYAANLNYGIQARDEVQDLTEYEVKVQGNIVIVEIPEVITLELTGMSIDAEGTNFDATMSDMIKLTRTVDDFEHSTYTAENGITLSYWLYMPENASNVPIMIWEHGGGEYLSSSYEGAQMYSNRGPVSWIESGQETAVLSVQYLENYAFGISEEEGLETITLMEKYNDAKVEFVNTLVAAGKINANKINVAGLSSGGGNTMRFIMQYPEYFASATIIALKDVVTPISIRYGVAYKGIGATSEEEIANALYISETDITDIYAETESSLSAYLASNDHTISDLPPIWFFHAKYDEVCHSVATDAVVAALGGEGDTVKYTQYSYAEMQGKGLFGHVSWVPALNDENLVPWVYSQTRL